MQNITDNQIKVPISSLSAPARHPRAELLRCLASAPTGSRGTPSAPVSAQGSIAQLAVASDARVDIKVAWQEKGLTFGTEAPEQKRLYYVRASAYVHRVEFLGSGKLSHSKTSNIMARREAHENGAAADTIPADLARRRDLKASFDTRSEISSSVGAIGPSALRNELKPKRMTRGPTRKFPGCAVMSFD